MNPPGCSCWVDIREGCNLCIASGVCTPFGMVFLLLCPMDPSASEVDGSGTILRAANL